MILERVNIGEVKSFSDEGILACYGLGSCLGLFLQDRRLNIAGCAHIFLPHPGYDSVPLYRGYDVESAVAELLEQFVRHGSSLQGLRAKLVGGASVVGNDVFETGKRNVESALKQLTLRQIFVAAMDVGGRQSRTAKMDVSSGMLYVRSENANVKMI